jgi:LPXTG-motif cell wall-anchored protein
MTKSFSICLILAGAVLSLSAAPARGSDRDDLLSLLRSIQRTTGEVHAFYIDRVGRERITVGYDFASGAWYKGFSTYVGGVDSAGTAYEGRPVSGQVRPITVGPPRQFDTILEEHFPFVITRDFVNRPDLMKEVERVGGLFRVLMDTPLGKRRLEELPEGVDVSNKTVVLWIDHRGLVVKADDYAGNPGLQWVWNYDTPESVKWGVADSVNAATRVQVELRTSETSNPNRFSMPEVEKLAVGALLIADRQPLWFGKSVDAIVKSARAKRGSPQEFVPPGGGDGAATAQSPTPPGEKQKPVPREVTVIDPRPPDRTTTWLAAAGLGTIALAGFLWWRRKASA